MIQVVAETEEFFVVDKPATIPCHPSGAYRHNSLQYILKHMRPELTIFLVHRLDRLTSGLTIFTKTKEKAKCISEEIKNHTTQKCYLARVIGDFRLVKNHSKYHNNSWINLDQVDDNNKIIIKAPINVVSYRNGLYECHEDGKDCETTGE